MGKGIQFQNQCGISAFIKTFIWIFMHEVFNYSNEYAKNALHAKKNNIFFLKKHSDLKNIY